MTKEEFLNTPTGRKWFRSKTKDLTDKERSRKKKWILDPPSNVNRWLKWDKEVKDEIKNRERDI